MVIDAEAAAGVYGLDRDAVLGQFANQFGDAVDGCSEGLGGADLGADVDADAVGSEPAIAFVFVVDAARLADIDSEFVFAKAGGDVGVGLGEDIWINAQGKACFAFFPGGA
jgi:hypothetical protein